MPSALARVMKPWVTSAALVFAVAVAFNYPWELAQSALYMGQGDFGVRLWHCLRAAGGDGVLVLLISAGGAALTHRPDWFVQPGKVGYLWMLSAGLVIGVVVEWLGVHVGGRWGYGALMPVLPALEIGVVPVLQMLVLPPLIVRMASAAHQAIVRRSG